MQQRIGKPVEHFAQRQSLPLTTRLDDDSGIRQDVCPGFLQFICRQFDPGIAPHGIADRLPPRFSQAFCQQARRRHHHGFPAMTPGKGTDMLGTFAMHL